jgi:hypothetical protein
MLKNLASICAALIIAAGVFSTSAQAQRGKYGGGGAHVGGARMGGFSGARVGGFSGARIGGAGLASRGYGYRGAGLPSRSYAYRGAGLASRNYAYSGAGKYRHYGYRHRGQWYGHRYPYYGYGYGYYDDYWPYWGWGIAVGALAAADYGYYDEYAYDSAVAYCIRRFKSYDPVSRTYLGYDGYRHSCP